MYILENLGLNLFTKQKTFIKSILVYDRINYIFIYFKLTDDHVAQPTLALGFLFRQSFKGATFLSLLYPHVSCNTFELQCCIC